MQSRFSSLRTLTLPVGATTGPRIVLDGVTGQILVYDANGTLLIKIDGQYGFEGYDPQGHLRVRLSAPLVGQYSAVKLWTSDANELSPATISQNTSTLGKRGRTDYTPGDYGHGALGVHLFSSSSDNVQPSLLQVDGDSLINQGATTRPYVDLTGADLDVAGMELRVVVNQLYYGRQNGLANLPTVDGSYGRGIVASGIETTSPIVLSTTAGTYTQIVESSAFNAIAGRCYKISFFGSSNLLVAGSGFATTDSWDHKMQLKVGAGAYADVADVTIITRIFRLQVAAATRAPIPNHTALYRPAADASVQVRLVATKSSGAATVTSQYEGGASSAFYILVEDIGLAP